jgi:hypothetical protein
MVTVQISAEELETVERVLSTLHLKVAQTSPRVPRTMDS